MMIASVSSVNSFIKLVSSFIMSTFITSLQLHYTLYRVQSQVFILIFTNKNRAYQHSVVTPKS